MKRRGGGGVWRKGIGGEEEGKGRERGIGEEEEGWGWAEGDRRGGEEGRKGKGKRTGEKEGRGWTEGERDEWRRRGDNGRGESNE